MTDDGLHTDHSQVRNQRGRGATMLSVGLVLLSVMTVFPACHTALVPSPDVAVYQAVLMQIRQEVGRFGAGDDPGTSPPLALDRTVMMCPSSADRLPGSECVRESQLRFGLRFERVLTSTTREQLALSFRDRNRQRQPFPGRNLDGVVVVSPDELDAALKRQSGRTRGYSTFSLPAYSADGHALVFASYECGGLCGYGWLFLLERRGESWQLLSVETLWIS